MSRTSVVLASNPSLCSHGWDASPADFERSRAHLASPQGVEEFERAEEFIVACSRPTKAIARHASSHGYKHVAESWHREERGRAGDCIISNGAFIAAALSLGYRHRVIPGSPNCLFNFAKGFKGYWRQAT